MAYSSQTSRPWLMQVKAGNLKNSPSLVYPVTGSLNTAHRPAQRSQIWSKHSHRESAGQVYKQRVGSETGHRIENTPEASYTWLIKLSQIPCKDISSWSFVGIKLTLPHFGARIPWIRRVLIIDPRRTIDVVVYWTRILDNFALIRTQKRSRCPCQ